MKLSTLNMEATVYPVGDHLRDKAASPQYGLRLHFETSNWGPEVVLVY